MTDIITAAHDFGEAVKDTKELTAYFMAKDAYDTDTELQRLMFEYETQRTILGKEFEKPIEEQSPALIKAIRERVQALATEIVAFPTYRLFEDAKTAVNDLMQRINAEISRTVFGEKPASACTHDCSTCSGCSSHTEE